MKKKYSLALFIFRRDLRLPDNTALLQALEQAEQVIPCFIFDPRQTSDKNPYKSVNAIQFMIESLQDLDQELRKKKNTLYTFHGTASEIIKQLLKKLPIEAVFVNQDHTPFSIERDKKIEHICKKARIDFYVFHDALLLDPTTFRNKQHKPYKIFTPFYKAGLQLPVAKPVTRVATNFYNKSIKLPQIDLKKELSEKGKILTSTNPNILVRGGRSKSATILRTIKKFKDYDQTHDFPSIATTHLSAYNKFGTHSIREVLHVFIHALGANHPLTRQLYWRDFFYHIIWHFPHVLGHAFREEYDHVKWTGSTDQFEKWCMGKTGFPIVDAGMRQLNTTGYMHNRVRMIVASFLIKDLHVDWRKGEKYFAQQLVDYDPAVNNGNWQWCASTGCDAQPYFRIFNPWSQQKRFDPQCEYIKQWVPELVDYSAQEIHRHEKTPLKGYLKPIVNHAAERKKTLITYKNVRKK